MIRRPSKSALLCNLELRLANANCLDTQMSRNDIDDCLVMGMLAKSYDALRLWQKEKREFSVEKIKRYCSTLLSVRPVVDVVQCNDHSKSHKLMP